MGPETSSPLRLFFIDPETGEQKELTPYIAELSITEQKSEDNMIMVEACLDCAHADCNRKKDTKIRCKRWSQWVNPTRVACEEYIFSIPLSRISPSFVPQEQKGAS